MRDSADQGIWKETIEQKGEPGRERLPQVTLQFCKRAVPAALVLAPVFDRLQAFLSQRELGRSVDLGELERDEALPCRISVPSLGEA